MFVVKTLKDGVKMKGYSVLNINKLVLKLSIGAPVCAVVLSVETSDHK